MTDNVNIDIKECKSRILIMGNTVCRNKLDFHTDMMGLVNTYEKPIMFLTVDSNNGPQAWLKRWCKKNNYPITIFNKHSENYNNIKSAINQSNALIYYTFVSDSKPNYIDLAIKHKSKVKIILVK